MAENETEVKKEETPEWVKNLQETLNSLPGKIADALNPPPHDPPQEDPTPETETVQKIEVPTPEPPPEQEQETEPEPPKKSAAQRLKNFLF